MLTAIIVAAGSSQRMGFDKLFADLGGLPVAAHSIAAFEACAAVDSVLLITRPEREPAFRQLAKENGWTKLRDILPGGAARHLSVWNGLQAMASRTKGGADSFVAVHDAARPLVTPELIERCLRLARETGAACCAAPVSDTLKRASPDGRITGSVDRTDLWGMQTPQIFAFDALYQAYQSIIAANLTITDEASALEQLGQPVALLDSKDFNLKITYPSDLALANLMLQQRKLRSAPLFPA
jgi:2-C-methyl-D-erythritol 4-phosphate cytidylyltransferase